MKKMSFLFFCFEVLSLFFLIPKTVLGQTEIDSSKLYYNAIWYTQKGEVSIDSAINYFKKLNTNFLNNNDTINAISSLRSVTQGYFKKGAIFESEFSAVETLKLLERMPLNTFTKTTRKGLAIHLGMLYRKINDYNSSINYYNLALELSETSEDSVLVLNNLANIYTDHKQYNLAVNTLNIVYEKIKEIKDYKDRWTIVDNLGYNQSKLNFSGAIDRMLLALNMKLEKGDMEGTFSSYRHLTYYYIDRKDEFKARKYASKANDIADSLGLTSYKLEALRLNALLSKDKKIRELLRLSDSINNAKQLSENKYIDKKYNYAKKESELKEIELQKEREKFNKILFQSLVLFVLTLSVFLYFILKSKHKKDKIKQAYLKEIELSKKVHDELANDMSDLMNYVENDIKVPNDKKTLLLDNIEDLYLKTRDISTETGSIDLIHFSESLSNLLLQHNREGTKVVINDLNTIHWEKVPDYKKMIVFRCLQELMVNMKKHSKAKLVSIVFKEHNSKKEIRYVDDGIGVSIEQVKLNGLLNVESRIKSIQGTFNFTTSKGNGFKATLEFNS